MLKYKERKLENLFSTITEMRIGYWEKLSYDNSGNTWCTIYDSIGRSTGNTYLITPERLILKKMYIDSYTAITIWSIKWSDHDIKFYKDNDIHIEEIY